jgi:antitoxin VapB
MTDFIGRAKLFWNGRSQAVRLPRACRFEGDEVEVRREGDTVILTPAHAARWPRGYFNRLGRVTDDFEAPAPLPDSAHRDRVLDDL